MLIFDGNSCISICLKNSNPYVRLAVEDLRRDFQRTSESCILPRLVESECEYSLIIEENAPEAGEPILCESFSIKTEGSKIRISADGYLGTMWGIYTFSERVLGVDPCYLFNDLEAEKHKSLYFNGEEINEDTDGFAFRGIFINDEDLLTGWKDGGGIRHQPTPWYRLTLAPVVIDMVVETALRLKFNLVIPASFLNIDNPCEKALADAVARRGIYISQHHIEPLGVSSFTFENYLKKFGKIGKYSYTENPELFDEIWRYYAREWAKYDNVVWQIGIRGIGDRPIWQEADPTEEELKGYGALISSIYEKQKQIVLDATNGKARYFTSTLWMEGAALMSRGYLSLPEDVITVFADTGPSQTYCKDFHSYRFKADEAYGIYYHLQYYGCGPHLVPETGLDKLYYHVRLAYDKGCRAYFIMNASNIREFVFELTAYSKMTRGISSYSNEKYLDEYCRAFGEQAEELRGLVSRYFDELPALDISVLQWQHANYFHYNMERLPSPLKDFVAKDGIVLELCRWLAKRDGHGLYGALPDGRFSAVYNAVSAQLPKYESIRDGLSWLSKRLSPHLKKHIETKWLLFSNTLIYFYKCYKCLYEAKLCYDRLEDGEVTRLLIAARNGLAEYLKYRKIAEYGIFENWYRGDTKMGVPQLLLDIDFLVGRTPQIS